MKKLLNVFFYVALCTTLFISCKKENDLEPKPEPLGTITGRIVANNSAVPIRSGTVFTTSSGKAYITHTDATGSFTLQAPAGNRHITIQTGDGSMFRTEMDVMVVEGQSTQLAATAVRLDQVATLAYISGTYDKIENILVDSMGYTATSILWSDLNNPTAISGYDAIFINCTSQSNMSQVSFQTDYNLSNYVANGGSLYVSDWAVKALVGTHDLASNPCNIERTGGFIPDSLLCVRQTGTVSTVSNALIASASLQTYLNKPTIDAIVYNLTAWEKINYLNTNFWETMVTDPGGNPLLIRTNEYTNSSSGTISIGNTANNSYSQVCVNIGGQKITLTVKTTDVAAMVAAGATSGMCDNLLGSGRIYFTTFHNEPNGLVGADMKNILEYVILNL